MFTYHKLIIVLNLAAVLHAGNITIPIYENEDCQWNLEDTQAYTAKLCDIFNVARPSDLKNVVAEFPNPGLYSDIFIGTPPQPLKMCFDITSPDMWVRSSSCEGLLCAFLELVGFVIEKSRSFINLGFSFLHGEKCSTYSDNLHIGGADLLEQVFFGADSLPSYADAWLGLSQGGSTSGHSTVIQNLHAQKKIADSIFTVTLQHVSAGAQVGVLVFGNVAGKANDIITTPSIHNTLWQIQATFEGIGQSVSVTVSPIIDFNCPYIILGDLQYFNVFMSKCGAQKGNDGKYYVYIIENMPSLNLNIEGKPLTMTPEAYLRKVNDGYEVMVTFVEGLFCLGAPFHYNKSISFNCKNNMISFAPQS